MNLSFIGAVNLSNKPLEGISLNNYTEYYTEIINLFGVTRSNISVKLMIRIRWSHSLKQKLQKSILGLYIRLKKDTSSNNAVTQCEFQNYGLVVIKSGLTGIFSIPEIWTKGILFRKSKL